MVGDSGGLAKSNLSTAVVKLDAIGGSSVPLADIATVFGGKAAGLVRLWRSGVTVLPTWFVPIGVDVNEVLPTLKADAGSPIGLSWAVRSSASVEDGTQHSYAGLFSTELNIPLAQVPKALARVRQSVPVIEAGYASNRVGPIPVVLQPFVDADIAGVWLGDGIGGGMLEWSRSGPDAVVSGTVTPHQERWRSGLLAESGAALAVGQETIGGCCLAIEEAVGEPCDIEFCVRQEQVYWLQCRPVTAAIPPGPDSEGNSPAVSSTLPALYGIAAAGGRVTGRARVLDAPTDEAWERGDILVVKYTTIEWVPVMAEASALVTDVGGALSHAAIIARELGIPCVTGTGSATRLFRDDVTITVDGDIGQVWIGLRENGEHGS